MLLNKKALVRREECVACGCCVKICPKGAITIFKGIYAEVNKDLCVGCGKCVKECPASVIQIEKVIKKITDVDIMEKRA